VNLVSEHLTNREEKLLLEILKEIRKMQTSLQAFTAALSGLTTAVSLIPVGPAGGTDPGMTATQVTAAVAALNALTATLTADVAPAGGVPAAPTGVLGVSNGGGSITLTWPPVATATSYNVETASVAGTEVAPGTSVPAPAPTTPPSLVTYTVTGLNVGTTYFFEVNATNAAGTSALSAETTVIA
jgi:hypothetical protein